MAYGFLTQSTWFGLEPCRAQSWPGPSLQVWDIDRKLLQSHAMPQVAAYISDPATLLRATDMDQFLTLGPSKGAGSHGTLPSEATLLTHKVHRRQLRSMKCAPSGHSFNVFAVWSLVLGLWQERGVGEKGGDHTLFCMIYSTSPLTVD